MQKHEIIIEGRKIRYYTSDGFATTKPIVFLHGWGGDARIVSEILSDDKNYVSLDLPGFGGSELTESVWSLNDYVTFVEQSIEKLEINDPILCGHSFGGSVAALYAARHSDVKKLILIASAGMRRQSTRVKVVSGVSRVIKKLSWFFPHSIQNKLRQQWHQAIGAEDYASAGAMRPTMRKILTEDITDVLPKVAAETHLIWGDRDESTPLEQGRVMKELIPGSTLHVVPGAGHFVFLDSKIQFQQIMKSIV